MANGRVGRGDWEDKDRAGKRKQKTSMSVVKVMLFELSRA